MELVQKVQSKFPYISEDKLMEVVSQGEIVMLNEGDIFISEGDRTHKIAMVLQGMMRNFIMNDNGEEITVVFATEMQAISAYSTIFLDRPASETSVAVEPTVLLVVDFKEFKKKTESDPLYMRLYSEIMETLLVAAIERIEDFTKKNPEQRYLRLIETHGHLIERVPLKYLASYLGVTSPSLSRIRKRLSQNRNYL
jgi:CRP-like cAMP-binding protein